MVVVVSAVCASGEYSPDIWFTNEPDTVALAVSLCRLCPVRAVCNELATRGGERHGVWGGVLRESPRGRRGRPRKGVE